jgi:hypothetical protein
MADSCSCEKCGGRLLVYATRVVGSTRVRYRRCADCRTPAGKLYIPIRFAPVRTISSTAPRFTRGHNG